LKSAQKINFPNPIDINNHDNTAGLILMLSLHLSHLIQIGRCLALQRA